MRLPGTTSGYTASDSLDNISMAQMFDDETVDRDQVLGLFKVSNGSYVWYKDPTNNKPSWCFIDETPTINVVKVTAGILTVLVQVDLNFVVAVMVFFA